MALAPTLFTWDLSLADSDRNVYQTFALRFARHPSESEDYLITRVLAYCLEWDEDIAFSTGLSTPDLPAVLVKDPAGTLRAWIDVGLPEVPRLHKAGKQADQVVVYPHRPMDAWQRGLAGADFYASDRLRIVAIDTALIVAAGSRLQRRQRVSVARAGGELYLDLDDAHLTGSVRELTLR